MQPTLKPAGVETLGVVNTTLDRARLYFKYRPTRIPLAADPEASTHRAYGVPAVEFGDTSQSPEAAAELNRREGFQPTEVDEQIAAAHGDLLDGFFLLDREGIVRWAHIERISDFGKAVPETEILAAARALPR